MRYTQSCQGFSLAPSEGKGRGEGLLGEFILRSYIIGST